MPEAVAPAAPAAPRLNNGTFAPKAGATGIAPAEEAPGAAAAGGAPPPSGPQSVEDWGLEGEIDVYGEKQKVSFKSKAEALRELQVAAALKKRVRDIQEAERRIADRERATPQLTPEQQREQFRRQVIREAQLQEMTPAERENYTLKQQVAQFQRQQQEAQQAEQQKAEQARRAQMSQRAVAELEQAAQIAGLPYTHATMALMAEIQEEATGQGFPPLPPDLLAQEANKRFTERGVEPLKKLQGKSLLDRLGPDVVRSVLMAERERRGMAAAVRSPAAAVETHRLPEAGDDNVMGEAEAETALRQLRNSHRR